MIIKFWCDLKNYESIHLRWDAALDSGQELYREFAFVLEKLHGVEKVRMGRYSAEIEYAYWITGGMALMARVKAVIEDRLVAALVEDAFGEPIQVEFVDAT
jgi:hypothetical protein